MASKHSKLIEAVMLGASRLGHRLWRNERGIAYTRDGAVIRYGVGPNGTPDLIGYVVVTVTPDMVGKTLPVFAAVEAKTGEQGPRAEQERFLKFLDGRGGFATWGNDADDLVAELEPAQIQRRLTA